MQNPNFDSELIDETMSDEPAFTESDRPQGGDDVFKFDEVKTQQEETPADLSESKQVGDASASDEEENTPAVEEKRVPYSRFESKVNELRERDEIISGLEQRLEALETSRVQSNSQEDITVPQEWIELYGDSEVSAKAYKVQLQREQQLMEQATKNALDVLRQEQVKEIEISNQNESIIEDQLSSLRQSHGNKITPAVEEEVLSIVDEFSPVGSDGKYITLFPFDKAFEIYTLRNSKAQAQTVKARTDIASLTSDSSQGEVDSSDTSFKRGWDNWREAL